jgi:hypothetical protein
VRVQGIDGVHELTPDEVGGYVARVVATEDVGDLDFEGDDSTSLYILWSSGRALATATPARGDAVVAIERDPQEGPDVEFVLDNGQVDAWPYRTTIAATHLGDLAGAWARGERDARFTWTLDP